MNAIRNIIKIILFRQHRVHFYIKMLGKTKASNPFNKLIRNRLISKYHISIGINSKIGKNVILPHQYNITIGDGVVIGDNCRIYHNVTIGQNKGEYPIIEDGVTIYTGAIIVGQIRVGSNAVIGGGSVVTNDVQPNCIVAGVPAKPIRIRKENEEFA